jgi:heme-degrading monooxygenase HmoA
MTGQSPFSETLEPPYYAVIFTSQRTDGDHGYARMAEAMMQLAEKQPGYLGRESAREGSGFGITVSYWRDADSIVQWKAVAEHQAAQRFGYKRWYAHYHLRVAKVERAYSGPEGRDGVFASAAAAK